MKRVMTSCPRQIKSNFRDHWQIQGARPVHSPPRVQILLFEHTKFSKNPGFATGDVCFYMLHLVYSWKRKEIWLSASIIPPVLSFFSKTMQMYLKKIKYTVTDPESSIKRAQFQSQTFIPFKNSYKFYTMTVQFHNLTTFD